MSAPTSTLPATLTATALRRELGGRTILDGVSVVVGPGTCLGVVGPNGAGKSTLLRVLAGLDEPDGGAVNVVPPTATVGYLAQEPERRPGETVREFLARRTGAAAADAELVAAGEALGAGEAGADVRYTEALERWTALGAADIDARTEEVLVDLGLDHHLARRPVAVLSGGEAARVELAAVLLSRFDVLLLDEPTNNLDFDGLARLERFVVRRGGGTVLVSHDRTFLERTVTSVLELDEHTRTATTFDGGWLAYLEEKATARRHAEEAYEEYVDRRKTLTERAQQERLWSTVGARKAKKDTKEKDKNIRSARIEKSENLAARARRTERAMERLETVDKPWEPWELRFSIEQADRAGAVVVRLTDAVVERGSFRLGPLDVEVAWGERVLVRGPNGSGKSTLIGALLGRLPLVAGQRWMGPSVVVGELGQQREAFAGAPSLLHAFTGTTGMTVPEARSLLAKFGLGPDHVGRPTTSLSPGERTRAELATFQAVGVNLLVLDEPSNHLDMPAIEQLEAALATYTGTLLLVTHDRRMLEAVDVTSEIVLGA